MWLSHRLFEGVFWSVFFLCFLFNFLTFLFCSHLFLLLLKLDIHFFLLVFQHQLLSHKLPSTDGKSFEVKCFWIFSPENPEIISNIQMYGWLLAILRHPDSDMSIFFGGYDEDPRPFQNVAMSRQNLESSSAAETSFKLS